MKSAQQAAKQALSKNSPLSNRSEQQMQQPGQSVKRLSDSPERHQSALAWVWEQMADMYGDLWISKRGLKCQSSSWTEVIGKYSDRRVVVAVEKCRSEFPDFPPNPGQFEKLCEVSVEELGMPPADLAWIEAQKKANTGLKYSHIAIGEAVKRAGAYDIARATSQSDQKAMREKFLAEYRSIAKAMASGTLMLESDRDHNHEKFIERKMIESGVEQMRKHGADPDRYRGMTGADALNQIKKRLEGDH